MTKNDVISIFNDDIIILPNGSSVSAEDFAEVFTDAPGNPSYNDLLTIDGGTKGYKEFLDKCKAKGILI
jgi:hypothetical protein